MVYILIMATIRKQKVGKYTYWQIVESRRVDGKPKVFLLYHLGTAEQLLLKLSHGPVNKKIKSYSHGAVAALWKAAGELGLPDILATCFSSQRRDGLSVGQSLLLAAIHRAVAPGSKRSFADFARQTTLPRIAGFDPIQLDSQHFWDQMDTVTDAELEKAEQKITAGMLEKKLISAQLLFYDLTNFFTYIATDNEHAQLPQRGRNKQKRNDLRQVGLAQVVTKEFLLPVCSHIYKGNASEAKLFIPYLTQVRQKLEELSLDIQKLTLVFDKGSNSKNNFIKLDSAMIPYVASLTPSYHEDLLAIPICSYGRIRVNGRQVLCYRTKKTVWNKERVIVLFISENLREGQMRGLNQALEDRCEKLSDLKNKLLSPRARQRTRADVEKKVKEILKGERTYQLIDVSIQEREPGRFDIDWEIDRVAYQWVTRTYFGKRILVTCRDEWSNEEIIAAYQGQANIERVFKNMKNPYHNAVRPMYHWTDQKIKVHIFICILAQLLSQLLSKKAKEAGFIMDTGRLIDRLSEIREAEIITLANIKSKPVQETQLEEMDVELQRLYDHLVNTGF